MNELKELFDGMFVILNKDKISLFVKEMKSSIDNKDNFELSKEYIEKCKETGGPVMLDGQYLFGCLEDRTIEEVREQIAAVMGTNHNSIIEVVNDLLFRGDE